DAHVRRLGREDHGDQQLEGGVEVQLGGGMGVVVPQAAKDLVAFFFVHDQLMVPVTRTRLLPLAAGALLCRAARALICASMTFFRAISSPMTRKAPGGRTTSSTSL